MASSIEFYVTTTPGLEDVCVDELQTIDCVHDIKHTSVPGGLTFAASPFIDFSKIRSICTLNAFIGTIVDISRVDDVDTVLERFLEYPGIANDNWSVACQMKRLHDIKSGLGGQLAPPRTDWCAMSDHEMWLHCRDGDIESEVGEGLKEGIAFRVSCTRKNSVQHSSHQFTSLQAAGHLGWGVGQRYPHWRVDLKNPQVDIVFHIFDMSGIIAISLINEKQVSQRYRAPPLFDWITALSPPTAYSLCALLKPHIRPGMVICDPMCGIGTIPIEGALSFPECLFLGGEMNEESLHQAAANVAWVREHSPHTFRNVKNGGADSRETSILNIEFVRWDAGKMAVRNETVDIVICDMPFGMKHGNYRVNRKLYPIFFEEMSRILTHNGKVLLLTLEIKLIRKTLTVTRDLYEHSSLPVTIGGYKTRVFDIRKRRVDMQCAA